MLSVGSVGSVLSVGSVGSALSVLSIGSVLSAGSFEAAMGRIAEPLTGRPGPHRAYFVSALALARPGATTIVVEGRVDGELVFPPRGVLGFGYDPIFRPDGHDRTFGEMSSQEKHGIPADGSRALSHRARAFQEFARTCLVD